MGDCFQLPATAPSAFTLIMWLSALQAVSSATSHAGQILGAELPNESLLVLSGCASAAWPVATAVASARFCGPLCFFCVRRTAAPCRVAVAAPQTTRSAPSLCHPVLGSVNMRHVITSYTTHLRSGMQACIAASFSPRKNVTFDGAVTYHVHQVRVDL